MLRVFTAGESHGKYLVGILEGLPAGIEIDEEFIRQYLKRRRGGYGRGRRMNFEADEFEIAGGVIKGKTTGAPFSVIIKNSGTRDLEREPARTVPRPGHTDFAGALKYGFTDDFVPVIERSSARETAVRTAVLSVTVKFLKFLGIEVVGFSRAIGDVKVVSVPDDPTGIIKNREESIFYFPVPDYDEQAKALVDRMQEEGDTLGGIFEVRVFNIPPGLGSYVDPTRRLDTRLAAVIMGLNAVKAVEIGEGIEVAKKPGSEVQDEFAHRGRRKSNFAGGLEGGVTNGETLIVRGYLKPISTLRKRKKSFDLVTLEEKLAPYIRSDTVVVPAASVIAETLVAYVIADAILEKFGADSVNDIKTALKSYLKRIEKYF